MIFWYAWSHPLLFLLHHELAVAIISFSRVHHLSMKQEREEAFMDHLSTYILQTSPSAQWKMTQKLIQSNAYITYILHHFPLCLGCNIARGKRCTFTAVSLVLLGACRRFYAPKNEEKMVGNDLMLSLLLQTLSLMGKKKWNNISVGQQRWWCKVTHLLFDTSLIFCLPNKIQHGKWIAIAAGKRLLVCEINDAWKSTIMSAGSDDALDSKLTSKGTRRQSRRSVSPMMAMYSGQIETESAFVL